MTRLEERTNDSGSTHKAFYRRKTLEVRVTHFLIAISLCSIPVLCLIFEGRTGNAAGLNLPNDAPALFQDGVVLLAFQKGIAPDREQAIIASVGGTEIKRIGVGVHVVKVGPGRVLDAIRLLKRFPEVRYAEPDFVQSVAGIGRAPNDTDFGIQWAFKNTGQIVNGASGTPGADEHAIAAWGVSTGSSSVVAAVLDTGVQYSHPDLMGNMWSNPGGIGGCPAGTHGYNVVDGNCDPMDGDLAYNGHGTHIAGIIGAVGNNALGVTGTNWNSSIMAVKWIQNNGGAVGRNSDLISGMDWIIQAKQAGINVRVVNDSATWPGTAFSQAVSDEIDLLGANDILFVTAAGNTGQDNDMIPRYPCSYSRPNMLCVAMTDQNDNLYPASNYGLTSVQLAAPGVNIYSTLRLSNYGYISGTSMSAGEVSGAAALILSQGYLPVASLKSRVLAAVDPLPSLSNAVSTGGRLNLCKALLGCGAPLIPTITSIPPVVQAGGIFQITGSSFTNGSVVNFFVSTASGAVNAGPLSPLSPHDSALMVVPVPGSIGLGQGFVSVQVVNTDQSYTSSNTVSALLQGSDLAGIPTITSVNGIPLAATSSNPAYAVNNVETVVSQGAIVTLGGRGFDALNGVAVDLFCACPGGKVGPFWIFPGTPALTATQITFLLPAPGVPGSPVTGPGSFVVSNAGPAETYVQKSNAVSVPIGQKISITSVSQSGNTITVNGSGFSTATVINFFNTKNGSIVNLGGFTGGTPNIPLTFINSNQFTFSKPAGAFAGPSYVEAFNPPFVPYSSSGSGPAGHLMLN